MAPKPAHDARGKATGGNIAASLVLLAAVFLVERLAPAETKKAPRPNTIRDGAVPTGESRGRNAEWPSEMPEKRWRDILFHVYSNIGDHRILALAAGMKYYSLLAIFPALAALVAIYGLFADAGTIAKHLDQVTGFIPSGAIEVARDQLTRVASKGHQTLGLTTAIGLAISLWSANAAMKSLFDTLNIVYDEREKRGFFKLNAMSLGFTFAAIAFVVAALGAMVVLPVVLDYLWLPNFADLLIRIARWPAMFLVVAFALACVYRFGASRKAPRWRWISWGSVAATVIWLAASFLFSWYAANFGKFNETYGSLGGAIGFMTWLWISAIAILLGAELDAEMEHQTAEDTTKGPSKPLGVRGVYMANTVGAAASR